LLALCFSLATLSLVLALALSFIVHLHLESIALRPLPVPPKEPSVGSSHEESEDAGVRGATSITVGYQGIATLPGMSMNLEQDSEGCQRAGRVVI
jgi:hypothetical protein